MGLTKKILLAVSFILLSCQLAFGAAADMAVTVAGAGDGSGTAGDGTTLEWDNAMSLAQWEADVEGAMEAGDRYFILSGTYALTNDFNAPSAIGTAASPTKFIGVKTGTTAEPPTFSDWAFTTDRPLIQAGAWVFTGTLPDFLHIHNLRMTTTDSVGLSVDNQCLIQNSKVYQSSGSAFEAMQIGNECSVINCDLQSDNGQALFSSFGGTHLIAGNYFHDSVTGFEPDNTDDNIIIGNIFDTCTTGIEALDSNSNYVLYNTFYNCTTGYHTNEVAGHGVYISNIFDECTTPADWGSALGAEWFDYNSWDGDASSNVNVTVGGNSIDSDITLGDPGNGDFTVAAASAPLDAGFQMGPNQGLKAGVDTKWNIGQDQDDNTVGGTTDIFGWLN